MTEKKSENLPAETLDGMEEIKYSFYPLIPLRDIVIFPKVVVPLFVGRHKSVKAIEYAKENDKELVLATQIDSTVNDPTSDQIYDIAVKAKIIQSVKLPDGTLKILVEAIERVKIAQHLEEEQYNLVLVESLPNENTENIKVKAQARALITKFEDYVKLNSKVNHEVIQSLDSITDPSHICDLVASNLQIDVKKKQEFLSMIDVKERSTKLLETIQYEINVLETEQHIRNEVKSQMEKNQREYFLNEQLKVINKELGNQEDIKSELSEIEYKISKLKLSKDARDKAKDEVKKLKMMKKEKSLKSYS